jgi:hypothetical protein
MKILWNKLDGIFIGLLLTDLRFSQCTEVGKYKNGLSRKKLITGIAATERHEIKNYCQRRNYIKKYVN